VSGLRLSPGPAGWLRIGWTCQSCASLFVARGQSTRQAGYRRLHHHSAMASSRRPSTQIDPSDLGGIFEALRVDGFVVTRAGVEEFEALAGDLGRPVAVRRGGPTTDELMPTAKGQAAARSLSAIYGLGSFPFHTDAASHRVPPRYLLMRLADGVSSTTPTLLVDADPRSFCLHDSKVLMRERWLVRGGLGRTFYAPVLDPSQRFLRFDTGCMSPPSGTVLRGHEIIDRRLARTPPVAIEWATNVTLIADNWRVLHSRPGVALADERRILLRKLLT
jgi:hypothetical protein